MSGPQFSFTLELIKDPQNRRILKSLLDTMDELVEWILYKYDLEAKKVVIKLAFGFLCYRHVEYCSFALTFKFMNLIFLIYLNYWYQCVLAFYSIINSLLFKLSYALHLNKTWSIWLNKVIDFFILKDGIGLNKLWTLQARWKLQHV